jgi:hypothetical protein
VSMSWISVSAEFLGIINFGKKVFCQRFYTNMTGEGKYLKGKKLFYKLVVMYLHLGI